MKILRAILSVLVAAALPLFLIMSVIRLLFTPLLLQIEYNLPGFPEDVYGFTTEDRLRWGTISLEYIVNNEDISFLSEQKLPDGQPLYNERELSHMQDVQVLFQLMIRVWTGLALFLILAGGLAWLSKWLPSYWKAVSTGGYLTLGLIGLSLVGILAGFSGFFTGFHRLFFTGDTWLFQYDDSLIRLFPMKLWQDGFTTAGVLSGVFGLAAALLPRRWTRI
jgi:integral membrane protein (TIGR01906 family)